jgi:tetratricopeptide (TPR) repeat protein
MSTKMQTHVVWFALVGSLSAAGVVSAQPVPRPAPPVAPTPRPPAPPVAAVPPVAPLPPAAPVPPWNDFNFDFNNDFNFDFDFSDLKALKLDVDGIRESARAAAESARAFAFAQLGPNPPNPPDPPRVFPRGRDKDAEADALYNQARQSIDQSRYERAIEQLDRLMSLAGGNRVDAALYWKSYALAKQGQRPEALTTLADLMKRFGDSRWLKDAKALEVEVRQASGQAVSPDAQNDEELKLLALRGIMQSDPERALPMIERLLAANGSIKLRENALFVLSQSGSPKAREIIAGIAKGGANPDLQLRAVRYLGAIGGPENRQLLDEVYRNTNDRVIKRAVLQALFASGNTDKVIDIAKTEKDVELRRTAIRYLGSKNAGAKTGEALRAIYGGDAGIEVRREVIGALSRQDAAATLVELAKIEKDPALKKEIVQRLSNIKSKEATDYLLELLK